MRFDAFVDWTTRPEEGIKYYSGQATYRKHSTFRTRQLARKSISTGEVKDLVEVRLKR